MARLRLTLEGAHSRAPASGFIVSLPVPGSVCKTQSLVSPFAGDIGGQMGLFIGASILTILELFDYIYEVRFGGYPRGKQQDGGTPRHRTKPG